MLRFTSYPRPTRKKVLSLNVTVSSSTLFVSNTQDLRLNDVVQISNPAERWQPTLPLITTRSILMLQQNLIVMVTGGLIKLSARKPRLLGDIKFVASYPSQLTLSA